MEAYGEKALFRSEHHHTGPRAVVIVGLFALTSSLRADSVGSGSNDASLSVSGGAGTTLEWNANPSGWYLNAQAFVDHPDAGPAGSFMQSSEAYNPGGTGSVATGPISEGSLASVDFVSAEWLSDGGRLRIGQPGGPGPDGVFASMSSPGVAFADARADLANLFRLTPTDPGDPSPTATLAFSLNGSLSLFGQDMPAGGFAESLLSVNIYDAATLGPPVFSWSPFDRIDGPGSDSLNAPLGFISDDIVLEFNHDYVFEITDDKEVRVPEPLTMTLLVLGGMAAVARRRRVAPPAARPVT